MAEKKKFYQAHLNNVSRSFAFCVEELKSPYREWVGLSYILCRLVDTIEDYQWSSQELQDQAFDQFYKFIEKGVEDSLEFERWKHSFPPQITDSEKRLVSDSEIFFKDLSELPTSIRQSIRGSVLDMTRGMKYFVQNYKQNNVLKLNSLLETEQYCFFVAGVVGELLTHIFSEAHSEILEDPSVFTRAIRFGFYLQKINILKDQLEDEKKGRNFIHFRDELLSSVKHDLDQAFEYLKAIPVSDNGFRVFCAWSLFLGIASLPWIQKSWKQKKLIKIPRLEAMILIQNVKSIANSNKELTELYHKMIQKVDFPSISSSDNMSSNIDMLSLYKGKLSKTQLSELSLF